jgi:hypothetical protein
VTNPRAPFSGIGPVPVGTGGVIEIVGKLLAWREAGPEVLRMPGSPSSYIALFSTEEALRAFYARLGWKLVPRIQIVDDRDEFVLSIAVYPDLEIIVDPYYTPEGRVRYRQLRLGELRGTSS